MTDEKEKGTEIAEAQPMMPAAAPVMDAMAIWESIEKMALNPDVDADKIGKLLEYQMTLVKYTAHQAFVLAKNSAMAEMPVITKDSKIIHPGKNGGPDKLICRYKKYDDLRRIIDPILRKHGLHISHKPGSSAAGKPTVTPILEFAKDGHTWVEEGGDMELSLDVTGAKNNTQGAGSTLSYGQRYTTCAMLGITFEDEDDDGNGGGNVNQEDWQKTLIDDAQKAAVGGSKTYKIFFQSQSAMRRGYLVDCGGHEKLKTAAETHDAKMKQGEK